MLKADTTEASEDGVSISVSEFPTEFSITVPVLLLDVIVDKVEGGFFDAFDLRVSFWGSGKWKLWITFWFSLALEIRLRDEKLRVASIVVMIAP